MGILSQENIKMWPSAVAAFVHVVASHEKLGRKHRWLFAIFQLQSGLHYLSEGNGVARPAVLLISVVTSEIIAINISEVHGFRKITIWDRLCFLVLLHEFLGFGKGGLELLVAINSELFLGRCRFLFLCKHLISIKTFYLSKFDCSIALRSIFSMRLLIFAYISSPTKVCFVNSLN
jgi:hypothetical protein